MNDWYATLPTKRMAAGALLFNGAGEVLAVRLSYKDDWSIPGGVVDAQESPREACVREIKEEIGLDLNNLDLVCVDYVRVPEEKKESVQFVFNGGVLSSEQVGNIRIDGKEIVEYKFVDYQEAMLLWGGEQKMSARRFLKSFVAICENKPPFYLENAS